MILFLIACPLAMDDEPTYPVYDVQCRHYWTPAEANLRIKAQDPFLWDTIAIDIDQGENDWSAQLREIEVGTWEIEMNLWELDCDSDYDLGFYFLIYQ